jgi:hypothetical protein
MGHVKGGSVATYHDVHYTAFHMYLPGVLRGGGFDVFLQSVHEGWIREFVVEVWKQTAKSLGSTGTRSKVASVGPNDLRTHITSPVPGWTAVIIATPPIEEGLEAVMVAVVFEDGKSRAPHYFMCEAPMFDGAPFMVGKSLEDGRSNLGPMPDLSVEAFLDVIVRSLPHSEEIRRPMTPSKPSSPGRFGGPGVMPTESATSAGIPAAQGPISFASTWKESATILAEETLANLYRLLTARKKALVMKTKKATGLAKKVESYVQFMWTDDDLIVEIQADYSHWGVSVPSQAWPQFEREKLSLPGQKSANFQRLVPISLPHDQKLVALSGIFSVFQNVLEPTGKILESYF